MMKRKDSLMNILKPGSALTGFVLEGLKDPVLYTSAHTNDAQVLVVESSAAEWTGTYIGFAIAQGIQVSPTQFAVRLTMDQTSTLINQLLEIFLEGNPTKHQKTKLLGLMRETLSTNRTKMENEYGQQQN